MLTPTNYFHVRKRMTEAKQKTSEARTFVEEQVAERERVRAAKEKMKVQITKAVKIQVRTVNIPNTYRWILILLNNLCKFNTFNTFHSGLVENDDGKEMSWTLQKEEEASSSGSSCSSSRDGWQEEKIS